VTFVSASIQQLSEACADCSDCMVVTGACDNPDVLDKEAGALALRAFISLHEATGDEQWVAPARQAATFVETWTYAW
jgi:hypothetical protein